jgi:zinc protease
VQRDRWRKMTPADVERVALAWLKPANRTVAQFVPDATPDRSPAPPAVDRAAMFRDYKGDPAVAAGESLDPTPATLDARTERFTLPNGMKVALLPKKTRGETVRLSLVLHQGDEKSLFGAAPRGGLTAAMLMRGTQKRSRQEIEDTLDRLRARLSVDGGETSWTVAGEAVRAGLPETLKLVAEVLREPAFPPAEFEKLQREQIAALEATRAEPEALVTRAQERYGNPYPPGDVRYAPTLDEEVRQVGAVTLADLAAFHSRFAGASHAELSIVGDFDAAATRAAITELFGTWASPAPHTRVPDPLVARAPTSIVLETPDKANAKVEGQLELPLTDASPDYPALITATYLLGQVENSRLWKRIRDKEGLSYGVYAYVEPNSHEPNSTFRVGAIFAPENFARLKAAFAEELARAARDGFTAAEVAEAKAGLVRLRRLARTRDASLAGSLVLQAELGRTFAFSGKVDAAIEALTVADVNAALRKYVDPAQIVWAYAGDFAKAKK